MKISEKKAAEKMFWQKAPFLKKLGIWDEKHREILKEYCQVVAEWERLRQENKNAPLLILGEKNPAIVKEHKLAHRMLTLARKLGFTPLSRAEGTYLHLDLVEDEELD